MSCIRSSRRTTAVWVVRLRKRRTDNPACRPTRRWNFEHIFLAGLATGSKGSIIALFLQLHGSRLVSSLVPNRLAARWRLEEDSMVRTNRGRVILGGLLAGLVINIVEYITNGVVLKEGWGQA